MLSFARPAAASGSNRAMTTAVAVALPGTGSDADFARRAFGPVAARTGLRLVAVEPEPTGVVASYRNALDAAARSGPLLIGGISIGAAVALAWAAEHPELTAAVLAVLPPWSGEPDGAPAALSATITATQLRADGLDAVVARMQAGSPTWLADALTKSWHAQWPNLPAALEEAAGFLAPDQAQLSTLTVPVGVVGATDDPVHPFAVAEQWARWIPDAGLGRVTLAEIGADPGVLGTTALDAVPGRVATSHPGTNRS